MASSKIKIGLLYGGRSAEHEISLQSAQNVLNALDTENYEPTLIGITPSGQWLLNSDPSNTIKINESDDPVVLIPQSGGDLYNLKTHKFITKLDVVFPVLHGPFGEDGTIQGLLKIVDVPFVGASVVGSAVGMDKDVMKRLLRDAGLPIGKFITLHAGQSLPSYQKVCDLLGQPTFVKPANLGSSVGINKVVDEQSYNKALAEAFKFDRKIIIEEFIAGREIELAVLGNSHNVRVSVPGEIKPTHDFYSYDAKYIDAAGAALSIPAELDKKIIIKLQDAALQVHRVLDCEGLGRVDFFVKDDGTILINEINTMPGFTKISMYPRLWQQSGISYSKLIDELIQLGFERHASESHLHTKIDSF